jgi:ATP-dependent DNA helicase RecG
MTDLQLLQSAHLYQIDPQSETKGFTHAKILLFGTDQLILSALPAHRTDLILRKVNVDRYDDRDLVRTNLIDSYDRIVAFAQKHLPDPFYLEGIERISLRDIIFREVASNLLIHREYTNATPARLIIEYGLVKTENANKPHGFGTLTLANFSPYPKNPVIGAFFREIHRADELGSGMRKLMRYGKTYGGADPELIEGDIFRMIIRVPEFGAAAPNGEQTNGDVPSVSQVGTKPEPSQGLSQGQVEAQLEPSLSQVCPTSVPSLSQVCPKLKYSASAGWSVLSPNLWIDLLTRTEHDSKNKLSFPCWKLVCSK